MTIQNLDNWRRLVQDPVNGDPSIPEAYADPRIGDKVVFQIMDGLIALYAGAPFGDANYAIHYGTLYASKDPVAMDAVALRKSMNGATELKWSLLQSWQSISRPRLVTG